MDPHNNIVSNTQMDDLANQMFSLQQQMEKIQVKDKKTYTTQELCPYLFDTGLYMPPFPQGHVVQNFPKYKGSGNLIHVR